MYIEGGRVREGAMWIQRSSFLRFGKRISTGHPRLDEEHYRTHRRDYVSGTIHIAVQEHGRANVLIFLTAQFVSATMRGREPLIYHVAPVTSLTFIYV